MAAHCKQMELVASIKNETEQKINKQNPNYNKKS